MYVNTEAFSPKNLGDSQWFDWSCEYAVSMIDDVLIFGKNHEEYDKHLTMALEKIQKSELILNKEKCQFSKDRITTFLSQL